jgi:ribonuclease HI
VILPGATQPTYGFGFLLPPAYTNNRCEVAAMQRGVSWVIHNLGGVEYDYLLVEGDSQLIINFGTREYTPRSIPLYTAID